MLKSSDKESLESLRLEKIKLILMIQLSVEVLNVNKQFSHCNKHFEFKLEEVVLTH